MRRQWIQLEFQQSQQHQSQSHPQCRHLLLLEETQQQQHHHQQQHARGTHTVDQNYFTTGPIRRILKAMAQMKSIGLDDVLKKHVALFSDYQNDQQWGFKKAIGEVKKHGYIEFRGGNAVRLTTKGRSALRSMGVTTTITPIQSNAEAHVRIKRLKPMQPKHCEIFDALSDGQPMLRSDLGEEGWIR